MWFYLGFSALKPELSKSVYMNSTLNRAQIEQLVRASLSRQAGVVGPVAKVGPNPLVVNSSARHCHLSQEAVETLFGKGHQLKPMKMLYQEGQYAAHESVTLIGPRSRIISNLRILGPCRDFNQVELSYTDSISLGFKVPVTNSGNIAGTPGCMLMGPAGFLEMEEGVIRGREQELYEATRRRRTRRHLRPDFCPRRPVFQTRGAHRYR